MWPIIKTLIVGFLILLCFIFIAVFFLVMGLDPVFRKPTEREINRLRVEFPAAKAKWLAHGIQDYSIEVDGGNSFESCDVKLIVRNGELADVEVHIPPLDPTKAYRRFSDSPVPTEYWVDAWNSPPICRYEELTISTMLEDLELSLEKANPERDLFQVEFDPEWGFITCYMYKAHAGFGLWAGSMIADGWASYQFSDFQPLAP